MNTERIKEIQKLTAYPDSISVQQALLRVWNECEQEKVVNKNDLLPDVMQRSELLSCPECCSGNVYMAMNEEKYLCLECKHEWAT